MLDILAVSSFFVTKQGSKNHPCAHHPQYWCWVHDSLLELEFQSDQLVRTNNFTIHRVQGCHAVGEACLQRPSAHNLAGPVAHKPSIFRGGWNSPPISSLWTQETVKNLSFAVCGAGPCVDMAGSPALCVSARLERPLQLVHAPVHYIILSRFCLTF